MFQSLHAADPTYPAIGPRSASPILVSHGFSKSPSENIHLARTETGPKLEQPLAAAKFFGQVHSSVDQILAMLSEIQSITEFVLRYPEMDEETLHSLQTELDGCIQAVDTTARSCGSAATNHIPAKLYLDGSLALSHTAHAVRDVAACQILHTNLQDGETRTVRVQIQANARPACLTIPDSILADPLTRDLELRLAGRVGSETFYFPSGTKMKELAATINLFADQTGVSAKLAPIAPLAGDCSPNTTRTLELSSTDRDSTAFVDFEVYKTDRKRESQDLLFSQRCSGTDIEATVDGVPATGRGNSFHVQTASLELWLSLCQHSISSEFQIGITGGGVLVNVNGCLVRLGMDSMLPQHLGGSSGRLFQIASGQSCCLASDPPRANQIVREAMLRVQLVQRFIGRMQYQLEDPPHQEPDLPENPEKVNQHHELSHPISSRPKLNSLLVRAESSLCQFQDIGEDFFLRR